MNTAQERPFTRLMKLNSGKGLSPLQESIRLFYLENIQGKLHEDGSRWTLEEVIALLTEDGVSLEVIHERERALQRVANSSF